MHLLKQRHKGDGKKGLSSESGQSVILVAVLILSFLMFFSFAVNTGLLISAKISVQTAADAAAYAGAAAQGRILNEISFLNYDMRRQYKKYIFRSNFVGSIGNPGFPNSFGPGSDYDYPKMDATASNSQHKMSLMVPAICIPLTVGGTPDDNCLHVNIKNSTYDLKQMLAGGVGMDSIAGALISDTQRITNAQEKLCVSHGSVNYFVLNAWLFRGDSAPAALDTMFAGMASSTTLTPADFAKMKSTVESLVVGMGLYPRNIVTLMRINTLAGFLNSSANNNVKDLTVDNIQSYERGPVAEQMEKTILAFKSAAANLNTEVFDQNLTRMTELQNPKQFSVTPTTINFNAYVQMMKPSAANGATNATFCGSSVYAFPALGAPVGVTVDPGSKVDYAVKIKAYIKPKGLLFLPGSDPLELDAIAGAKPFGSRIGPKTPPVLVRSIQPNPVNGEVINDCKSSLAACDIPYLDVGAKASMMSSNWLAELLGTAVGANGQINFQGMLQAQWHAMAPTPEEVGHYNILPPPFKGPDQPKYNFQFINFNNATAVDGNGTNRSVYKFYAPIFPATGGDPNAFIDKIISQMFETTNSSGSSNSFGINLKDVGANVSQTLKDYIKKIDTSGELGETSTLASLELGMDNLTPGKSAQFWLTQANQVMSSWAPDAVRTTVGNGDAAFQFQPRFGYSVKFVSMQDLMNGDGLQPDDPDAEKVTH